MTINDLPSAYGTIYGTGNPYEGSQVPSGISVYDRSISGWGPPTIQRTPWREKVQFLRYDKRAVIRYEIDKEGPHVHYDKNGYKLKIFLPESQTITLHEFISKASEVKQQGNGIIESLKKKKANPTNE